MTETIQQYMIAYKTIKSFQEYETYLVQFKSPPRLVLQKKKYFNDQIYDLQSLEHKILSQQPDNQQISSQSQSNIVQTYRIGFLTATYQNVIIYTNLYIHKDTTLINTKLNVNKTQLQLKIQFQQQAQDYTMILQMNIDVTSYLDNINGLKQIKENIQNLMQSGNLKSIYNLSNQIEMCINTQPILIDQISKPVYSQSDLNNIIAKVLMKDVQEIELFKFLTFDVYNKKYPDGTIKDLLNNPVQISRNIVNKYIYWENFILSPKLDGQRALFILFKGTLYLQYEASLEIISKDLSQFENFVFETEVFEHVIYFYDIHFYGQTILFQSYHQRLEIMSSIIQKIQQSLMTHCEYTLTPKQYLKITKEMTENPIMLKGLFNSMLNQTYPLDGIILNTDTIYNKQEIFKWKPIEKLTIDFTCKKITQQQLAINLNSNKNDDDDNMVYYGLFCLVSNQHLQNIYMTNPLKIRTNTGDNLLIFQSPLLNNPAFLTRLQKQDIENPLQDRIVECSYNTSNQTWELYRIRTDKEYKLKQYGNYYTVALKLLDTIINPVNFEDLYTKKNSYFQKNHDEIYKQMTQYINEVKNKVIRKVCKKEKRVIDLACGKGQDLFKYLKQQIEQLISVEIDEDAIKIAEQRCRSYVQQLNLKNIKLDFQRLDLSNNKTPIILNQIAKQQHISFVNCNLAIHYFIHNTALFTDFLCNIKGIVSFTFFNGQKIFNLLQKQEDVQLLKDKTVIYHYQKKYNEKTLLDIGMKIMIKLPFTIGLIEEPIFAPEYLEKMMIQSGFQCIQKLDMDCEFIEGNVISSEDITQLKQNFNALNKNDQTHVSLYTLYMFKSKDYQFQTKD